MVNSNIKIVEQNSKIIFILGCERSGSTWLSNILDAHSDVIFYMEPFADYAAIFPGFPHRNFYLNSVNEAFSNHMTGIFDTLPNLKYNFLSKPHTPPIYFKIDRMYVELIDRISRILKIGLSTKTIKYNLLNLNRRDEFFTLKKSKIPFNEFIPVIKELRLNFKVSMIHKMYPDARVLVTIRNPGAQISSIIRLFDAGGLPELQRSLLLFRVYLFSNLRFQKYFELIQNFDKQSIEERLVAWWLINYEVLLEDLKANNLQYKVVHHEDISENSLKEVSEIFDFLQISIDENVKNYVLQSTESNSRGKSVINTQRNSKEYYKTQIQKVEVSLMNNINRVFDNVDSLVSEIAQYHN